MTRLGFRVSLFADEILRLGAEFGGLGFGCSEFSVQAKGFSL